MIKHHWSKAWVYLTLAMVLAGLLYSSWPLGYWLNPRAVIGIASNLEANNQPYNWLFVLLDIICGALIIGATWWLLRTVRRHKRRKDRYWLESAIIGFGVFGFLTMLDALLPLDCIDRDQQCLAAFQDPYFVMHSAVNMASIAALALSIVAIWWLVAHDKRAFRAGKLVLHGLLLAWFCFGVGTAVLVALDNSGGPAQHVFILFSSFWIVAIPYYVWHVLRIRPELPGSRRSSRGHAGGS